MAVLPIVEAWPEIERVLKDGRHLLLTAEPGAGKTTELPQRVQRALGGHVLVLEPRRIAARAAAERVAENCGWIVGQEVGYQVRLENRTSKQTRITFMTEGLLAARMHDDPLLDGVSAVILDEFHERNLHSDVALALVSELALLERPNLRVIVMSATLDTAGFERLLQPLEQIHVPGRTHPIEIHYDSHPLHPDIGPVLMERLEKSLLAAHKDQDTRPLPGRGVLAFLPGLGEIRRLKARLSGSSLANDAAIFELHGQLTLAEQSRVLRDSSNSPRLVLATNIAETSLTLEGIGTVIDAGLERVGRYQGDSFSEVRVERITRASATQRAGRAGRWAAGRCYKLWNRTDERSFSDQIEPEILRSSLSDTWLQLLSAGHSHPESMNWLTIPHANAIRDACVELLELGMLESSESLKLTRRGQFAASVGLSLRAAAVLSEAIDRGRALQGVLLAALISEGDFFHSGDVPLNRAEENCDLSHRYRILSEASQAGKIASSIPGLDVERLRRILRLSDALRARIGVRTADAAKTNRNAELSDPELQRLLYAGFCGLRVAQRRRPSESRFRLSSGRGVELDARSLARSGEFIMVVGDQIHQRASGEPLIRWVAHLDRRFLDEWAQHVRSVRRIEINSGRAFAFERKMLGELVLSSAGPLQAAPDEAFPVLVEWVRKNWSTLVAGSSALLRLDARLRFLEAQRIGEWPQLTDAKDESVVKLIEQTVYGKTEMGSSSSLDLFLTLFEQSLSSAHRKLLESEAPESFCLPSGRWSSIEYVLGEPPTIEGKIQEFFGSKDTPRVARGSVPLRLRLLGPHQRPVQTTSDLVGFWQTSYPEIRKELRGRYPKHPWPEDPTSAEPSIKARRS